MQQLHFVPGRRLGQQPWTRSKLFTKKARGSFFAPLDRWTFQTAHTFHAFWVAALEFGEPTWRRRSLLEAWRKSGSARVWDGRQMDSWRAMPVNCTQALWLSRWNLELVLRKLSSLWLSREEKRLQNFFGLVWLVTATIATCRADCGSKSRAVSYWQQRDRPWSLGRRLAEPVAEITHLWSCSPLLVRFDSTNIIFSVVFFKILHDNTSKKWALRGVDIYA